MSEKSPVAKEEETQVPAAVPMDTGEETPQVPIKLQNGIMPEDVQGADSEDRVCALCSSTDGGGRFTGITAAKAGLYMSIWPDRVEVLKEIRDETTDAKHFVCGRCRAIGARAQRESQELEEGTAGAVAPKNKVNNRRRKIIPRLDVKGRRVHKVPRCSSPSHFYVDAVEQSKFGPDFLHKMPDRIRLNSVLEGVSALYYHKKTIAEDGLTVIDYTDENDQFAYPTLDMLMNPLRKPHVMDEWSPRDVALFEAGICEKGKDFHAIAQLIPSKRTGAVVDFYYHWKQSAHYQMWKSFGRPHRKGKRKANFDSETVENDMKRFKANSDAK